MKTIGLIGGISWESTVEYYRLINQGVQARLGGVSSANCLIHSFNFAEIEALQKQGAWDEASRLMVNVARNLERGGAECLLICANTMHRMAGDVQTAVDIPLLHIADATARAVQQAGMSRVGLLGTIYTMEHEFLKSRLSIKHGLDVRVPESGARQVVNEVIFGELVKGIVRDESREKYLGIMGTLAADGAEGIILGCTELGMLVKPTHTDIPLFDTTALHAAAAVEFALG